jgi:hypothetical protein
MQQIRNNPAAPLSRQVAEYHRIRDEMFQVERRISARLALVRYPGRSIVNAATACVRWRVGVAMTLIDLGLWLVLAGLVVIIPFGCIMTRQKRNLDQPRGDLST